ncbi:MAG: Tim44 domain-containing protein [Magnetospirillum sp.]|nr:Tim44 domain-containing protein [Magnetospirillum sp.]
MNDGFHFLDIVFFAMVAAFLVLRLRSVLGKRTGQERRPDQWQAAPPAKPAAEPADSPAGDNVIELPRPRRSAAEPSPSTPAGAGIAAIRAADPAFDIDGFLAGARAAFEMIVHAYAAGDKAALQPLLSPEVFRQFADAIEARRRAGESLETELVGIKALTIVEARMEGSHAVVTLRFTSEQVNVVRDAHGEIVEGDPTHVAEVVDEWSFRRDTRARDPNWALVATRTPDPEP